MWKNLNDSGFCKEHNEISGPITGYYLTEYHQMPTEDWDSSVSNTTAYGLHSRNSIPDRGCQLGFDSRQRLPARIRFSTEAASRDSILDRGCQLGSILDRGSQLGFDSRQRLPAGIRFSAEATSWDSGIGRGTNYFAHHIQSKGSIKGREQLWVQNVELYLSTGTSLANPVAYLEFKEIVQ
jgi:hypothetical protein